MTKYDPLKSFLAEKGNSSVPMSFEQIERLINSSLPPSARKHRAWWSNNPSNSVITYAWLSAGYKSSDVNLEGEKVVFRKTEEPPKTPPSGQPNPLWGCMAGTVTIPDHVDLTEPAMPEWAEMTHNLELSDE